MPIPPHPVVSPDLADGEDQISDEAIERVMQEVPSGAVALSGLTVGLMLLAWFLIYALVFLPRGMVS
jgi:hypothetical protein